MKKLEERNNKNLYIFGTGKWGRITGLYLIVKGIFFEGFVETMKSRESVFNKKVYNVDETDGQYLVCAEHNSKQIECELYKRKKNYDLINEADYRIMLQELIRYDKNEHIKYLDYTLLFLYYHRIGNTYKGIRKINIDEEVFDSQMRYIKNNFSIERFEDDWDVHERSVIIGFDDGYSDVYECALPILEKYEIPATVFVSSKHISEGGQLWNDKLEILFLNDTIKLDEYYKFHYITRMNIPPTVIDEYIELMCSMKGIDFATYDNSNRLLTEDELKKLSRSSLITIGGHTYTHIDLSNAFKETAAVMNDLKIDKANIERIIGRDINVFSYPYGGYGEGTDKLLKDIGYKKARCSDNGLIKKEDDHFFLKGNSVPNIRGDDFENWLYELWFASIE